MGKTTHKIKTIVLSGPKGKLYVIRTETSITITPNPFHATNYPSLGDDHEEIISQDFMSLTSYLYDKVELDIIDLYIADISLTMIEEEVDISLTNIPSKLRHSGIKKLNKSEIDILGLKSDAMHVKLSSDGKKEPMKIGSYKRIPKISISAIEMKKTLGAKLSTADDDFDYDDL